MDELSQKEAGTIAFIGLGSNQGDVVANLKGAITSLTAIPGVRFLAASSLYTTEPQGLADQPFFGNQVVSLVCDAGVSPEGLLGAMLQIEAAFGRVREGAVKNGPRPLDLDLLLFGTIHRNTHDLELPHPRMLERAFVLVPLAEIAPNIRLPQGMTVAKALSDIDYSMTDGCIYQQL